MAEEREAIAVDVHDVLGHSLTVINLKSELAKRLVDTDPHRAKAELEELASIARTSLAEVRSTVTRAHSPNFAGEVHATGRALETVGITADLPDDPGVAGSNHTLFAWALRELCTNVVRHSRARHCVVKVSSQKLQVTDDGIGFDAQLSSPSGGLTGLHERVSRAGGKLVFKKDPGTTVLITMNGDEELL